MASLGVQISHNFLVMDDIEIAPIKKEVFRVILG
jgi:hypothetical protein